MDLLGLSLGAPSAIAAARTITQTTANASAPFLKFLESASNLLAEKSSTHELDSSDKLYPANLHPTNLEAWFEPIHDRLRQLADVFDISLDEPTTVEVTAEGRIELHNQQSERTLLEMLINADPSITDAIDQLSRFTERAASPQQSA